MINLRFFKSLSKLTKCILACFTFLYKKIAYSCESLLSHYIKYGYSLPESIKSHFSLVFPWKHNITILKNPITSLWRGSF